jgi:pseudoazurin
MTYRMVLAALSLAMLTEPAIAKDVTVQMKNQGAAGIMVFEPGFVAAAVGDTIHFVPTDMGHNATPITGMIPDGVDAPMGGMNKEYVLKLTKPGLYGIKCTPHFSMGMVALVKAGSGPAPNAGAAAAVKLPPLAAKRMQPMLAKAQ